MNQHHPLYVGSFWLIVVLVCVAGISWCLRAELVELLERLGVRSRVTCSRRAVPRCRGAVPAHRVPAPSIVCVAAPSAPERARSAGEGPSSGTPEATSAWPSPASVDVADPVEAITAIVGAKRARVAVWSPGRMPKGWR